MQELTLENLQREVARAEAERKEDHAKFKSFPPYDPSAPIPQPTHEHIFFDDVTFLSFDKTTDETQKDFFRTTCFHGIEDESSVIERAAALSDLVSDLEENREKRESGSSLNVQLIWQDKSTTHILVANVGKIRTVLYNPDADAQENRVTRLTCEHHLSRKHEQKDLTARGFKIRTLDSGTLDIFKEKKLVAKQVGAELFPLVPWPNESGSATTTRSLGNELSHQETGIFTSTPSISYYSVPRNQRCYLLTCNTGITECVSDEEMAYILGKTDSRSRRTRLRTIAGLATKRGREEKISLSIIPLRDGMLSAIHCFTSAHRGNEIADVVSHSIEFTFNNVIRTRRKKMYEAAKRKLAPAELNYLLPTLRLAEGNIFYLHGHRTVHLIDAFIALEALAKKTLRRLAKTWAYPATLDHDADLALSAEKFKSGNLTAYELLSAIINKSLHFSSMAGNRAEPDFFKENYFHDYLSSETTFINALNRFIETVDHRVKTLAGRIEAILRIK